MIWELDALKILARNATVPGVALKDAIGEIERLQRELEAANKDADNLSELLTDSLTADYPVSTAPEARPVRELCELWGYGAVLSAVVTLWARKDDNGAFTVGHCRATVRNALKAHDKRVRKANRND